MNDPSKYLCSEKSSEGLEDFNLGLCLDELNVIHCDTRDEAGETRFLDYNPIILLNPDFDVNPYCKYVYPYETGEKCCAKSTISFHYVSAEEMYTFEFFIYKLKLLR